MRIFTGVELPDAIRQTAAERIAALRSRMEGAAPDSALRWVDPANLHITIWFIGEVPDATFPRIAEALADPYRIAAFPLRLGSVGMFPSPARPRVIWAGVLSGGESLAALNQEVGERLQPLGFEPERRAFSAHLTLARVKHLRPADRSAVQAALDPPFAPFAPFRVADLTLFRSRLSPRGARYESLLRVPLR